MNRLLASICALTMYINGAALASEASLIAGQTVHMRLAGVPLAEIQSVTGDYIISSEGRLKVPHLKAEVSAAGLTATQLAERIQKAYVAEEIYTHPNIVITTRGMEAVAQSVISVGGEVRQPGDVVFRPGITLYAAICSRGGFTEFANPRKVKLIRRNSEQVIDLRKVSEQNNLVLEASDQVVVPPG